MSSNLSSSTRSFFKGVKKSKTILDEVDSEEDYDTSFSVHSYTPLEDSSVEVDNITTHSHGGSPFRKKKDIKEVFLAG